MQKTEFELQGIQFPSTIREDGASVEIMQLDAKKAVATRDLEDWVSENSSTGKENPWKVISFAKAKEESMFLILSERKVERTRFRIQSGRLTKVQEQMTELDVGEIHLRKTGLLELYSVPSKQRRGVLTSLSEFFGGSEALSTLSLDKGAMMELIGRAPEVTSVSLSGIGNPFFSDMTLTGQDPINSRTFKELLPSATLKSFRARLQLGPSGGDPGDLGMALVNVGNNCKVRFYAGRSPISQSDVEDYLSGIRKSAKLGDFSE